MLEGMTWEQLLEWRAALDVAGVDDHWQQLGRVELELMRTQLLLRAVNGDEKAADDIGKLPESNGPPPPAATKKPANMMSPSKAGRLWAAQIVGGNGG